MGVVFIIFGASVYEWSDYMLILIEIVIAESNSFSSFNVLFLPLNVLQEAALAFS